MTKLQIISDKNKKSLKIKNLLIKKIKSNNFKKDNLIIVVGGDGFMLQTLKKNKSTKKHFYGINSGNYGFLMNKFSSKYIIKNLLKRHEETTNSSIGTSIIKNWSSSLEKFIKDVPHDFKKVLKDQQKSNRKKVLKKVSGF